MNKQTQEALKMALNALCIADAIAVEYTGLELEQINPAIIACKEALEQPAQEPDITQIIKKYKGEMTYYDHEPLGVYFTIGHFEKLLNELKG
jgi:hypothetical protein